MNDLLRRETGAAVRLAVSALAVAVLGLSAGCGAPTTPSPPAAATATPPAEEPAQDPADAACAANPGTASTVRAIAEAVRKEPVLPASVALILFDARSRATRPGITDPVLAAAQVELVAAIDDLDAQGQAGLPPGGNPAQDTVRLDTARILDAVEAVELACATRA